MTRLRLLRKPFKAKQNTKALKMLSLSIKPAKKHLEQEQNKQDKYNKTTQKKKKKQRSNGDGHHKRILSSL